MVAEKRAAASADDKPDGRGADADAEDAAASGWGKALNGVRSAVAGGRRAGTDTGAAVALTGVVVAEEEEAARTCGAYVSTGDDATTPLTGGSAAPCTSTSVAENSRDSAVDTDGSASVAATAAAAADMGCGDAAGCGGVVPAPECGLPLLTLLLELLLPVDVLGSGGVVLLGSAVCPCAAEVVVAWWVCGW